MLALLPVLLLLLMQVGLGESAGPLRMTVRELQSSAVTGKSGGPEVEIEGAVTWADASAGEYFYIQDATGGIRVNYSEGPGPTLGDHILVRGIPAAGSFSPLIDKASYSRLGQGRLPWPALASSGGLLNGSYNEEWIRTDGWVRKAEFVDGGALLVVLDSGGARISLRISNASTLKPESMIASKATVSGVACPVRSRDATGQLVEVQILVPRVEDFHLGLRETVSPWEKPHTPLNSVFRYHPGQTRGDRLRIRGKVLMTSGDTAWIHDGDAGLAIRGGTTGLKRGDFIEVVGFREIESFLPVFSDVIVREDKGPPISPEPKVVPASDLLKGAYHGDLVAVSGHLLDRIETPAGNYTRHLVLALQSPRGVFTAELESPYSVVLPPGWQPGSLLQIAGICLLQTDPSGDPSGFKILVPDPSAITVLQPAPYFTPRRMLVLLCFVLTILLALAVAAVFLARRNARLKAEVRERHAVASERNRLARDLHDTLEQGLTGLQLQIKAMNISLEGSPDKLHSRLDIIRDLVKHCRWEIRRSIWDLRADGLETFELGDSLNRMAQSLSLGSDIRVKFRQNRNGGNIPGLLADNLLRIGQEAMTNALKHARPKLIEIELFTAHNNARVQVSDDGIGFSPSSARGVSEGHFGVAGMKERAERMGATLTFEERTGGGTVVSVEVPLPSQSRNSSLQ